MVVRRIKVPTPEELADQARQREWRTASVRRLTEKRVARLDQLKGPAFGEALQRAEDFYETLAAPDAQLRLREPFVALTTNRPLPPKLGGPEPEERSPAARRRRDWATRPPLTRQIMGKSHALPSYLAMIYVAQADPALAGHRWRNTRANAARRDGEASWAVVCGRWTSGQRARRARIVRDLQDLAATDLVEIRQGQGRFEDFKLLREDGSGKVYRAPAPGLFWPNALSLPGTFIRRGWHLVLSPVEIATLLVARHHYLVTPRNSSEPGVGLPESTRWARYGLSGEAYGRIHELEEFGLLKVYDTMPERRHGRFRQQDPARRAQQEAEDQDFAPVTYRLEPAADDAFDRPARATVEACLTENAAPPRLLDVPSTLVLPDPLSGP